MAKSLDILIESVRIDQDFLIESVRIVQECLAFFHCHKQVMTKYRISFDLKLLYLT